MIPTANGPQNAAPKPMVECKARVAPRYPSGAAATAPAVKDAESPVTVMPYTNESIATSRYGISPVKNLLLEWVGRYVGKQYIDNTSSEDRVLAPYFINDLMVSYQLRPEFLEEVLFQIRLANLLNVEYETNAWVYRYYSGGTEGVYDGFYPQAGTHLMFGVRLIF